MKRLLLLFGIFLGVASWSFAQVTAPVTESFTTSSTPTGWSLSATSGGPWSFSGSTNSVNCAPAPDHTGNGGNYAWMDQSGTDAGVVLEMPDVNVGSLTTPYLEFYYWMCGVGYTPPNLTIVETYNGTSWVVLDSITQATSGWKYFGYDLTGLTHGTNLVRVRFRAESGGAGSDFYGDNAIDDVSILEAPTCQQPSSLSATSINAFDATIKWNAVTNAINGYTIIYGASGFDPATGGTTTTSANDSVFLSGLSAATAYDAYIITDCGATDGLSDTAGPIGFITACAPLTAPYYSGFENDAQDVPPQCWEDYKTYSGSSVEVEDFSGRLHHTRVRRRSTFIVALAKLLIPYLLLARNFPI